MTHLNGLDDLRASLHAHADTAIDAVPDTIHVARGAALQTRIRRARNQRRAGIAGGIAAALLVTGGVSATTTLPDRHASGPQIADHTLERSLELNGFDYRLGRTAQSSPGGRQLMITLPATDRDRYVRLVGDGIGAGDATLMTGIDRPEKDEQGITTYGEGSVLDRIATDRGLDAPVPVPSEKTILTVRLRNASPDAVVGLAVYDQDAPVPGGVSADTMTFPQAVGTGRLVAATIGTVGERSVSITFEGPVRNPDLESLCTTTSTNVSGHVTEAGRKGWAGSGCDRPDPVFDTNLGLFHGEGVPMNGYGPGTHTLTLTARHVSDRAGHAGHADHDTALAADEAKDLRLALGLYDDTSPVRTVAGSDWDETMLVDGQLWHLDEVVPYREGITIDATAGPVMLGQAFRGSTDYCLEAAGSQHDVFSFGCNSSNVSPGGTWGQRLMPGASYVLTTSSMDHPDQPGRGISDVLVYRPVE